MPIQTSVVSFARAASVISLPLNNPSRDRPFEVGDRQNHDIDDVLLNDLANCQKEIGAGLVPACFMRTCISDWTEGSDPAAHVAVLGVADREPFRSGIVAKSREFFVEAHGNVAAVASGLGFATFQQSS